MTGGIVFEGKKAIASVVGASGVAEERFKSVSRIVVTRCIRKKRAAARRRIFVARRAEVSIRASAVIELAIRRAGLGVFKAISAADLFFLPGG